MNGPTKRRFTKLLAATTVMAGAGVGVFQLTGGGWNLSGENTASVIAPQQLRADDAPHSTTLDAIADALSAESREKMSLTPAPVAAEPQPSATSSQPDLEPTLAAAEHDEPTDAPATADRVGRPGMVPVEPVTVTNPERSDPSPYVAALGDRYATTAPSADFETESAEADRLPENSEWTEITRGQEPEDDQDDADDAELGFADDTDTAAATQLRAQAAFSDRPPTAPESRYGMAATAEADETQPAQPPGAGVDPFARRQPAPLSTAGQSHPMGEDNTQRVNPLRAGATLSQQNSFEFPSNSGSQMQPASEAFANDNVNSIAPRTKSWDSGGDQLGGPLGDETPAAEGTGRPGERALEGPQQPALVIQKLAPSEIQVGKPAAFQITVQNVGKRPADAVVVRDQIPQGTRLISTTPRAESTGGELFWDLGTLSVGEQRELEILLMPTAEGEIGSVATVTSSTQASVKTRCTLPQLALRLTAPRQVMIGSEQRVRIELHNPGTGDATGVMLYENVPEELRHTSGPALEFEVGTLRAGETREMELVLTAEKPGRVVNRISARGDGNLQVEQKIEFDVIAPALEVAVDGPRLRYLERPATYTVQVGNPGTAAAHDIELVTKLPKGLRFVSANNLGEYDTETHAVYWSLAELPEGEVGTVELVALPIETGEHEIKVESKAQQGLEDETSQHVLVEGLAAIMFEVRDLDDPIEVGGETTYEIRIVNQGTKAATGVQVQAAVQPGMKVIAASGETRHEIQSGGVVFDPLTSLAPKADTMYRVQVQGVRAGDQRIAVEVSTDDIGDPIRKEESTRVFGDQ